ncbi:AI-2E family transporter [Candidatus Uhrbacteria bacterium]|jgi:predicted PurR-regulated permease PerM|nr:AI-2E family transporter [Candidatus Uhrbacteria bacterium]
MPKRLIKPTNITISTGTVIRILAVLIGITFLWFIRDIMAIFFVALLLAALIEPFASWFEKKHIPRGLGVIVVYILLLSVMSLGLTIILPPLIGQIIELSKGLPVTYVEAREVLEQIVAISQEYGFSENLASSLGGLQDGITSTIEGLFVTVKGIFGGLATLMFVMVVAFYMVIEEDLAKKVFRHFAPKKYQPYLSGLASRIQTKLGAWLRGQIILMFIIGLLTYVGLLIIGVDYALALGIFAGIAEIVPYAGPIIAMVPAVIISFTISPLKAIIVAAMYFGIQQLENSVLTPKIMEKSVGLNPIISLLSLLVGFRLGGVLFESLQLFGNIIGALLAIPVATMIAVVMRDFIGEFDKRRSE